MKQVTIINKVIPAESRSKYGTSGRSSVISGGASVDLSPYLLKAIWERNFEERKDEAGNEYIYIKKPIVGAAGLTTFAGDEIKVDSIFKGLPIDTETLQWVDGVLTVVGGGAGGGASNWDELKGKPSWITDTKPTYAWGEITQKPTTLSGYGIQASDVLNTLKSVDGSGSGLDADTLDGKHLSTAESIFNGIAYTAGDGVMEIGRYLDFHYDSTDTSDYSTRLCISSKGNSNTVNLPTKTGTLALTTDNVASATKLQTARTIWGQSFDGTANVTGSLTSVTDITGTGTFTGANIKATDSVYVNGIRLHKTVDGAVTIEGNLLVTGGITAYADGEDSGGTGGGVIVIDNLTSTLTDAALSANQGRILKGLIDSKVSNWGELEGKPTTIAGYGISASDVLSTLKTVDGSGSGLDSDLLGGYHSISYDLSIDLGNCGDYGWYVIGILQITDYTLTGNHANGRLGFFRENGNNPVQQIQYSMSTKYDSTDVRLSYIILGQKIVYPCTFTYNGKKWAGFVVKQTSNYSKSIRCTRFGGRVSEKSTPFLLKYYTSNTSTINNSEVYSSIQINGTDIVDDSVSSGTFYCDSLQSNNDIYIDGIRLYKNNNRLSINSDLSVTNEIRFSLTSYTTEFEGGRIIATDSENLYLQGGDSGTIWITARNTKVLSSLEIKANNFNINGNKIWHAGNDGSGSGMDADLLDGFHRGNSVNNIPTLINFPDYLTISPSTNTDDYIDKVLGWAYNNCNAGNRTVLLGCGRPNSIGNILMQLYGDRGINSEGYPEYSSAIFIPLNSNPRYFGTDNYKFYSKIFAFITDNVASATKLQTARTIWGQSFDGTANVSGSLTGVTNITASGSISCGSLRTTDISGNGSSLYIGNSNNSSYVYLREDMKASSGNWSIPVNGNATFASATINGALTVPYSGGKWISMATRSNVIQANQNQSQVSAHVLFRVKSYNGNAVCFGGLGNKVGFYGFTASNISSGTNNIQWMTAWNTENGHLGIGTDTPSERLHVIGNILATGGGTFYSSDIRAKTIIERPKLSLNSIANSPVIKFKWNGYNGLKDDNKLHVGGIAQYIEKILPECVIGQKDDFLSFDYATTGYVFSVLTARHLLSYETRTDRIIRKLKERIKRLERQLNIENHEEVCIVAD